MTNWDEMCPDCGEPIPRHWTNGGKIICPARRRDKVSEPTCGHCGGLHYGSPRGKCVYICERCGSDIRCDANPRCECAPEPDKVPDRVIDALDVNERFLRSLSHSQLIGFVVNLRAEVAQLEAEKQDARRVGLEFALHLANETADWCIEEQEKGYLGAMRVADAIKKELSKPTDIPSSANRAEGRQG